MNERRSKFDYEFAQRKECGAGNLSYAMSFQINVGVWLLSQQQANGINVQIIQLLNTTCDVK